MSWLLIFSFNFNNVSVLIYQQNQKDNLKYQKFVKFDTILYLEKELFSFRGNSQNNK